MRRILTALVLAWAGVLNAENPLPLVVNYDLDATSYTYCRHVGGAVIGKPKDVFLPITTSGSSTTVTSVASNGAFTTVVVGDILYFNIPQTDAALAATAGPVTRYVTARASADSITINAAVELPASGITFSYTAPECGTTAADGWFGIDSYDAATLQIQIAQLNVTGGIDYSLECGLIIGPSTSGIYTSDSVATANLTAVGTTTIALSEPYNICRLGLKIGSADDGDDLTTNTEQVTVLVGRR
jgi:hypothetical protein